MLFTAETTDDGDVRVYATQQASVVTFFTEDPQGGSTLHAEPGEFACRWSTTQTKIDAVRLAVLDEAARRLGCYPDQVELHEFEALMRVCDPLPRYRTTWSGARAKSLRRPVR